MSLLKLLARDRFHGSFFKIFFCIPFFFGIPSELIIISPCVSTEAFSFWREIVFMVAGWVFFYFYFIHFFFKSPVLQSACWVNLSIDLSIYLSTSWRSIFVSINLLRFRRSLYPQIEMDHQHNVVLPTRPNLFQALQRRSPTLWTKGKHWRWPRLTCWPPLILWPESRQTLKRTQTSNLLWFAADLNYRGFPLNFRSHVKWSDVQEKTFGCLVTIMIIVMNHACIALFSSENYYRNNNY